MDISILLLGLAGLAFALIIFEDIIHLNKAKSTLFIGSLSWLLLFIYAEPLGLENVQESLNENLLEISTLWLFLMAAMTFVAYLNSKGLIASIIYKLLPRHLTERKLMFLLAGFAFIFSSLADNITATLVSLALVLSLNLNTEKLVRFSVLVVFAVNSGGVALITGDVTTLMIFMADKVAIQHLLLLILPAFVGVLLLAHLLSRNFDHQPIHLTEMQVKASLLEKMVAVLFLLTILSAIAANILYQVPPLLTFLFGLSIMFLLGRLARRQDKDEHQLLDYIRVIEYDTLLFFLGILLVVGMLKEIGVLNYVPEVYTHLPIAIANYLTGLASALIDNVPLTAAVLKSDISMQTSDWLALTYAAGVGGSLLVIGSAAGIIALSKVESLSFFSYMRYLPYLALAYTSGYVLAYLMALWV
ncbi:Na+/H+ antiporter NhaD [Allopseudospirillum japonicum]|uniref:Na+/H+ antiporter NhaD n=1 Tax=Allopseudospirillum japonicum TaxID=64971 RepID=A0A1H6TKW4_9GAMM|nr:sodium:proton antiporter NhaD [Allopseudospirillum japonicum]SEI76422.1 Na+/H+ antiporter NhaD [Allopseudospirillum japonicum]